jgi:acetyl-CoA carboxylase beta subunit
VNLDRCHTGWWTCRVCEEVATCYQLAATRQLKAVLDVENDEQFESEVCVTLASTVQEIYVRCHTGWWTCRVCEEVATCYQLAATRQLKAVLDVENDEQFESEVCVTLASTVQEIYASLGRYLTGWRTCR